jgi:hypothetical protein
VVAALIAGTSNDAPLALVDENFAPASLIAIATFAALVAGLYGWMVRRSQNIAAGN